MAQRAECQIQMTEVLGLILSGVTFCCWILFLDSKASYAYVVIITNFVCLWKTQFEKHGFGFGSVNTGKITNFENMVSGHCTALHEHVISMKTSYFDIDFASQMKLTKLIHCFGIG